MEKPERVLGPLKNFKSLLAVLILSLGVAHESEAQISHSELERESIEVIMNNLGRISPSSVCSLVNRIENQIINIDSELSTQSYSEEDFAVLEEKRRVLEQKLDAILNYIEDNNLNLYFKDISNTPVNILKNELNAIISLHEGMINEIESTETKLAELLETKRKMRPNEQDYAKDLIQEITNTEKRLELIKNKLQRLVNLRIKWATAIAEAEKNDPLK